VRVIAGLLGGRVFNSPPGYRTHPMGDRVRTALFNTLGDIKGLTVLDAFAGSGAVGIEAVSRGAKMVVAVDADKDAARTIKENILLLGVGETMSCIRAFVHSWSRRTHEEFDVVVADPPYDAIDYKTLEALPKRCKVGGTLVYSLPPKARLLLPDTCELLVKKSYGDAILLFYRKHA
jgi:16S rRNA (guanine966-N2)-methyltransferase